MDEMVLNTQKWVNKTYKNVPGYTMAIENGRTGWPTIYALRQGLQKEMGISPVSSAYGPATEASVIKIVSKFKVGFSGNLVYLIQGAFWAKGISPGGLDGQFTTRTVSAIKTLQNNAGIVADGIMTPELMKAVLLQSFLISLF